MINPAAVSILGYSSREELLMIDVEGKYIDASEREHFQTILESEGVVYAFETKWLKADGSQIDISESARAIKDENGEVIYYEGIIEDITDRKKAERALIEAKEKVHASASDTMVARLTHARLFGSDSPYEERSTEEIIEEMKQLKKRYRDHDDHFLFEQHKNDIQLVVFNQGEEPIRGASLTLVLPNHDVFHVATQLPKLPKGRKFIERLPAEQADYPAVSLRDDSIHVSVKLGDIEPGEPTDVFFTPLRVCVGDKLKGRRLGIQYSLFAQNLRSPANGKLRLLL